MMFKMSLSTFLVQRYHQEDTQTASYMYFRKTAERCTTDSRALIAYKTRIGSFGRHFDNNFERDHQQIGRLSITEMLLKVEYD